MTLILSQGRTPLSLSMTLSGLVHLSLLLLLVHSPVTPNLDLTEIELIDSPATVIFQEQKAPVREKIALASAKKIEIADPVKDVVLSEKVVAKNEDIEGSSEPASTMELSAQEKYKGQIARLLNAKKSYPQIAKQLKQQGRVLVQFLVGNDGKILEAKVVSSSPFESLNKSAENLVRSLNGLSPFPEEIKKTTWLFTVPVDYQM